MDFLQNLQSGNVPFFDKNRESIEKCNKSWHLEPNFRNQQPDNFRYEITVAYNKIYNSAIVKGKIFDSKSFR